MLSVNSAASLPERLHLRTPRPYRLVALALLLTAASKLLLGVVFVLLLQTLTGVDAAIGIVAAILIVWALAELGVARAAWRGRMGSMTAVFVVLGLLSAGTLSIAQGLDTGEAFSIFTALTACYVMAAIALLASYRKQPTPIT